MSLGRLLSAAVLITVASLPSVCPAGDRMVVLKDTHMSVVSEDDTTLGSYYLLEVSIPSGVRSDNLYAVLLEFVVDVASREIQGQISEAPMLEVYRVTGDARTSLSSETLAKPSPACVNIPAGDARPIRVDVTDIVRDHLQLPAGNLELAIGSLSGARIGLFQIVSGRWGARTVARLTFVTRE